MLVFLALYRATIWAATQWLTKNLAKLVSDQRRASIKIIVISYWVSLARVPVVANYSAELVDNSPMMRETAYKKQQKTKQYLKQDFHIRQLLGVLIEICLQLESFQKIVISYWISPRGAAVKNTTTTIIY